MSRTSNTELRRGEIVSALLTVIAKVGYEKATTQAIAAQAQLAPGLIHYHFKSKQEILVSLVNAMADAARTRFEAILGEKTHCAERLHAYLQARLGLGEGEAPDIVAAWVMIGAEAVRQPEVRAVYRTMVADELALLTSLMTDCLSDRQRDTAGAPALAAGLLAMIEGAFQLSSVAGDALPAGYAAAAATAFAMQSVEAAPPARARGATVRSRGAAVA